MPGMPGMHGSLRGHTGLDTQHHWIQLRDVEKGDAFIFQEARIRCQHETSCVPFHFSRQKIYDILEELG